MRVGVISGPHRLDATVSFEGVDEAQLLMDSRRARPVGDPDAAAEIRPRTTR
jgi:hypothetical protein